MDRWAERIFSFITVGQLGCRSTGMTPVVIAAVCLPLRTGLKRRLVLKRDSHRLMWWDQLDFSSVEQTGVKVF